MARVVVSSELPGDALDRLRQAHQVRVLNRPAELADGIRSAEGLLSLLTDPLPASLLERAPQLRVIGNYAVGYDNVDVDAATRLGIQVCNTPDVLSDATADLAWALLLAAARRLVEADRYVRAGRFTGWEPGLLLGVPVHGQTLGIVGLGRIGRAMAARARGFGMRVLYHQRHRASDEQGARLVKKEELLAESDFVSLHVPLVEQTRHYLDGEAIALMKPTAVLVNTARGAVVDEAALAEALRVGRLSAAGLDVFEHEPRVHPALLELDNVVLAPHVGSATVATRVAMARAVADDILRVLAGQAPHNPVNQPTT